VAGDLDVLVVPDLDAGNILSKNLEYLASAKMAGIVMGAMVPVVLTSRSDPPRARVYSLALASLLC
jgi:phosphate butyryltransferase